MFMCSLPSPPPIVPPSLQHWGEGGFEVVAHHIMTERARTHSPGIISKKRKLVTLTEKFLSHFKLPNVSQKKLCTFFLPNNASGVGEKLSHSSKKGGSVKIKLRITEIVPPSQ